MSIEYIQISYVDGKNGVQGVKPQNIVDGQDGVGRPQAENITDEHTAVMIDGKSILDEIVFHLLQQERNSKWKRMNLTAKKFENVLTTADNIETHLTVKKLEMISDVYTLYTKGNMKFKKSDKKAIKVNEVSKIFGDKSIVAPVARQKSSASLQNLAHKYIIKPEYPKDVLAAACAKTHYIENIDMWESTFCAPITHVLKNTGHLYEHTAHQNILIPIK